MASFKEFLEDYEKKEDERSEKYFVRLKEGKVASDEMYPPKDRFTNLKEPIAKPFGGFSVWSVVPFYGSTLIPLLPRENSKQFDDAYADLKYGFSSRDIDRMIDLVKDTGRIQFIANFPPTRYQNLEFLEPLFTELEPPAIPDLLGELIDKPKNEAYSATFWQFAQYGLEEKIKSHLTNVGRAGVYIEETLSSFCSSYVGLEFLGYDKLAQRIEDLMIDNPSEAARWLAIFGNILVRPMTSPIKAINNFSTELISEFIDLCELDDIEQDFVPDEIGKFILENLVHYPETLDGCWEIMQYYDDEELYNVLGALNEGVKKQDIDIITANKDKISAILENVWAGTKKIKGTVKAVRWSIALGGALAAGLAGMGVYGILAGFGLSVGDTYLGLNSESISDKVAKVISPNYLVSLYDFKETDNID